jgi:hypothetical protein
MDNDMRCPECQRPICMRKLTLVGCNDKRVEEVIGESINGYYMVDYVCGS